MLFYRGKGEIERGFLNKKPIGRNGVPWIVDFHWLSCDSLSLAELLAGEKENLSSSCWGSGVVAKLVK